MLTLAGDAGLPVKVHFDWFVGAGVEPGEVTLCGDPCSEAILEQRAKDAELVDFFQNAPMCPAALDLEAMTTSSQGARR